MLISDLLTPETIIADLKATSKKQALQEIASYAAKQLKLEDRAVLDVLLERERLGSTGVGRGVAIPHGKMLGLSKLYLLFARLSTPIPFDSTDGWPVDLMFLLLTPENAGGDHLTALAKVSRLLRDEKMCMLLRGSENAEAIYSAILEHEQD
ncbi:MAG: PTS IIA-like nitrogen regulatory protein PtsN [Alphaproteobacteria bacterium]|nr:PTS IIA-like nitrogen regulatory protein PtsN [Alphaproteobacteria bacterium]MBO4644051.1 PTS IIA-like nitrogen regulatory protein PtsN [Alphaproteobacteria bacterium]